MSVSVQVRFKAQHSGKVSQWFILHPPPLIKYDYSISRYFSKFSLPTAPPPPEYQARWSPPWSLAQVQRWQGRQARSLVRRLPWEGWGNRPGLPAVGPRWHQV